MVKLAIKLFLFLLFDVVVVVAVLVCVFKECETVGKEAETKR